MQENKAVGQVCVLTLPDSFAGARSNIITKVTKTTPWISEMVVVRKANNLRLCLDSLHLRKGIIRKHYPTPTVEDIAPKLTKAKVFLVVAAKDGFLQVVLDEPSSYLTTLWTPLGRCRWQCMPR